MSEEHSENFAGHYFQHRISKNWVAKHASQFINAPSVHSIEYNQHTGWG